MRWGSAAAPGSFRLLRLRHRYCPGSSCQGGGCRGGYIQKSGERSSARPVTLQGGAGERGERSLVVGDWAWALRGQGLGRRGGAAQSGEEPEAFWQRQEGRPELGEKRSRGLRRATSASSFLAKRRETRRSFREGRAATAKDGASHSFSKLTTPSECMLSQDLGHGWLRCSNLYLMSCALVRPWLLQAP